MNTLKQNIEHPLEISIDTTLKTLKNSPNNRVGLWVWLCELRSFDLARLAGFMNERWKLRFVFGGSIHAKKERVISSRWRIVRVWLNL